MNSKSRMLSWCFVGIVGLTLGAYLLMAAAGPTPAVGGFDLETTGRLPVVDHGRVKPLDTLARVNLMILSGRQQYTDDKGDTQPAIRWLLDVMTAAYQQGSEDPLVIAGESRKVKAYRIEDPALRARLRLEGGPVYSYQEILDASGSARMKEMALEADDIQQRHPDLIKKPQELLAALNEPDRHLLELVFQMENHLRFARIETTHRVFRIDNPEVLALLGLKERSGFRYGFDEFLPRLGDLRREANRAREIKAANHTLFDHKALETYRHVEIYAGLAGGNADTLQLVAPLAKGGEFLSLEQAMKIERNFDKDDTEAMVQA